MTLNEKVQLGHIRKLEFCCADLRHAILDLPKGITRERLFVSLVKARKHVQEGHLQLTQAVFTSMAEVASDGGVSKEVTALLQKAQDRLSLLQRSLESEVA